MNWGVPTKRRFDGRLRARVTLGHSIERRACTINKFTGMYGIRFPLSTSVVLLLRDSEGSSPYTTERQVSAEAVPSNKGQKGKSKQQGSDPRLKAIRHNPV